MPNSYTTPLGRLFFQNGAPDAAAGQQLLGHAGGQLLLRLEHKALGVKIFGKAAMP